MKQWKVRTHLLLLASLLLSSVTGIGALGLYGMRSTVQGLEPVIDRLEPAVQGHREHPHHQRGKREQDCEQSADRGPGLCVVHGGSVGARYRRTNDES